MTNTTTKKKIISLANIFLIILISTNFAKAQIKNFNPEYWSLESIKTYRINSESKDFGGISGTNWNLENILEIETHVFWGAAGPVQPPSRSFCGDSPFVAFPALVVGTWSLSKTINSRYVPRTASRSWCGVLGDSRGDT